MRLFLLVLCSLVSLYSSAQSITVVEESTEKPLEMVTVYSPESEASSLTDRRGQANISEMTKSDSIIFRLIGYKPVIASYEELSKLGFRIELEKDQFSLNEVLISANKWEQQKRDIPRRITSIESEQITLQNPQTAADLLGTSGEVYIQKSQLGGGSPMIRGFATNRVLLVVDGVRMNNAIFRSGNLQNVISLDPNAISDAEVIFGPGSVIYGSDAIGGVMDFHTLQPKFSEDETTRFGGQAMARYASANNERTGHIDFNIGLNRWAFRTSVSFSEFDHQVMGKNGPDDYLRPVYQDIRNGRDTLIENPNPREQVPSGYGQVNIMQKVRFAPNSNFDINYGFHYSETTDLPRYDRLIRFDGDEPASAEWYYGPQKWMMHNLQAEWSRDEGIFDQARLTLAYQFFEESRHDRDFRGDIQQNRSENVHAYSANLDLNKKLSEQFSLFYGAEYVLNDIESRASAKNVNTGNVFDIQTRYPNGSSWQSSAAYFTGRYKPNKKLTFQAGLRYNHVYISAPFDTTFLPLPFSESELATGALNGNLGATYRPGASWQFNASASTGFRAPNIDDIGKVFDSTPGNVVVPNRDLSPEYAYNFEAGITKVFSETARLEGSAYYTILKDALTRRPYRLNGQDSIIYDGEMSRVFAIQNASEAYVYGVELSAEVNFLRHFSVLGHFNYQYGRQTSRPAPDADEEEVPLRHVAPPFGDLHLRYENQGLMLDLYGVYHDEFSHGELPPEERNDPAVYALDDNGLPYSPSWYTLNFKATYQASQSIQLSGGVENILNKRYRPFASGISAPGINFILAARVKI